MTSYLEDFACAQEISPQGNPPQEKVTAIQVYMVEATTGKLPTVGISRVKVSTVQVSKMDVFTGKVPLAEALRLHL